MITWTKPNIWQILWEEAHLGSPHRGDEHSRAFILLWAFPRGSLSTSLHHEIMMLASVLWPFGTFFLLILCEFHIMHPNPTHLSVPSHPLSALATSPYEKQEQTYKQENPSHHGSFCPHSCTCKCSWQCELLIWFKASGFCCTINPHWGFYWRSYCCLLSQRPCNFGYAVPVPLDCSSSSHMG